VSELISTNTNCVYHDIQAKRCHFFTINSSQFVPAGFFGGVFFLKGVFDCMFKYFCNFRLGHFDYVKPEDLEKIGMGKPATRRLIDAVKKRKATRKSRILDKVRS
jgi:hypothetical protein